MALWRIDLAAWVRDRAPNPAAREAGAEHDVRRQAVRMAAVLDQATADRR